MRVFRAGFILSLLSMLLGVSAYAQELRVGFIAPLSGELADVGISSLEGAKLAVDEANRGGGLLTSGKRVTVVLLIKDGQASPEKAVIAAQELINKDKVSAIIGPPLSSTAIPVARFAERAMIPMITPIATNAEVTKGADWVFRVCYTDISQATAMAQFSYRNLSARTAAVLFDVANTYNRTVAEMFASTFQRLGGRIVASETYTTGATDFRSQLERIKARQPAVLFLPNYVNDLRVQLDMIHSLRIPAQLIGSDSMAFREPADISRSEGAYYSTHFSIEIPSEAVRRFTAEYQSAYNRPPTPAGALTYDAFGLLFEAVRKCGSVNAGLIGQSLRSTGRYDGVTGTMDFSGSRDPKKPVVIVHIQDAKARFFTQIAP
jgi:branched-chain amino acid transport system substrate-binding protein